MKIITHWAHLIVKQLRLELIIARVGNHVRWLNKLLPLPHEYKTNIWKKIIRDGVCYRLNLQDYMQWSLFANVPDYSWHIASQIEIKEPIILDIGANVGQFGLKVANSYRINKRNCLVHLFEPNPEVFKNLAQNISLNPHLAGSVFSHQMAIGNVEKELSFAFSEKNTGGGAITTAETELKVPVMSLDKWVKVSHLDRLDFIKIDVEGYEPFVLLGAEEIITKHKPTIYIEMTDEWFKKNGFSSEWVFKYFWDHGYECFLEDGGALKKIKIVSDVSSRQYNLVARNHSNP